MKFSVIDSLALEMVVSVGVVISFSGRAVNFRVASRSSSNLIFSFVGVSLLAVVEKSPSGVHSFTEVMWSPSEVIEVSDFGMVLSVPKKMAASVGVLLLSLRGRE